MKGEIKVKDWNKEMEGKTFTDRRLLKSILVLRGMSEKELAAEADISYSAFLKKATGEVFFTVKDIFKIVRILDLSADELNKIFFNECILKESD